MNIHLLLPPLALLDNLNGGETIGLFCAVGGMVFAAVMGLGGMYFRHRQIALWHETARVALEKGQPVPASPAGLHDDSTPNPCAGLNPDQFAARQRAGRVRGYLIGGFINVAVGLGMFTALLNMNLRGPMRIEYFGLIPLFVGVGLLLGAAVEILAGRKLDRFTSQREL
jgi:hypothetical protein